MSRNSGSQLSKGLSPVRVMVRSGGVRFGEVGLGAVRSTTEWLFSGSIPERWLCPQGFWYGEVRYGKVRLGGVRFVLVRCNAEWFL